MVLKKPTPALDGAVGKIAEQTNTTIPQLI
jgi:hypothetical protein